MQRVYMPSSWLIEFKDDPSSRYWRFTRFPLADSDISLDDIHDYARRFRYTDDLRTLYAAYRSVLIDHASCVFQPLSDLDQHDKLMLAREILKMEPGVKMLRYRTFLMKNIAYQDTKATFDRFLERFDRTEYDSWDDRWLQRDRVGSH